MFTRDETNMLMTLVALKLDDLYEEEEEFIGDPIDRAEIEQFRELLSSAYQKLRVGS